MAENITERTEFADKALQEYLAEPLNPVYGDSSDEIAETDAFIAGWSASIKHLVEVAENMDIPGPMRAIIVDILEFNNSERPVKD